MVVSSPLVWYRHWAFVVLPLLVLLLQGTEKHHWLGLGLVLLVQSERLFEAAAVPAAVPVLLASFLMVGTLLRWYLREWRTYRRPGSHRVGLQA